MNDTIEAAASLIAATLARIILSHGSEVALEALKLAMPASFGPDFNGFEQESKPVNDPDVWITLPGRNLGVSNT